MSVLTSQTNQAQSSCIRGEWSLVQWNPDIVTEEFLNIGVALKANGETHFKMLDYFDRVKCLYDDATVTHLQDVIELTLHAMENQCFDFSQQMKCIQKGMAKGDNVEGILERLYGRSVTLGKHSCQESVKRSNFSPVQNEALAKRVSKNLRQKFKDDANVLAMLPDEQYVQAGNSRLFVPIRGTDDYATLASVVTSSVDKIRANYLGRVSDLMTAAIENQKKPALFLLRPSDECLANLEQRDASRLDDVIDHLNYNTSKQGVFIESESCEQELHEKMEFWMRKKAA